MRVFEFDNYKEFVNRLIRTFPKRGHGQFLKISKLLGIHTTMVTHIFKGDSNLSVEQGLKLSEHFGLSELETDFFITLIHLERAANTKSRQYFERQLQVLRTRALNLSERLQVKKSLDERDQAIFYSSWFYSGIRLLCATREFGSTEAISEITGIPIKIVNQVIEFLLSTGLIKEEGGRYVVGETVTYVNRDSPLVTRHHLNWRLKGIEQLDKISDEELVFTNSIAISQKDFLRIREEIVKFLEIYKKIGDPSPAEEVCYLNVDWRKLGTK